MERGLHMSRCVAFFFEITLVRVKYLPSFVSIYFMYMFVLVTIGIIIKSNSLRPYPRIIVCRYCTHPPAGMTPVTLRLLFNFLM